MAEMQQQMAAMQAQQAAAAVAPAAAPAGDDMMAKINQLSQLHSSGVLTDEEFAAAKAKVLAG
jgi:membrane protease subunit (stomatin/prohibitin family)